MPLRQNTRAQKLLLLLLTPLTAFWLMQLVLGSPPWNMSAGVALANWLCLSALYWIGCAIIGYPAVCCVLLHILAGMWGAANYFVSVFRGTPILPWDFKALGTAVAVAGSYSLSMTWQLPSALCWLHCLRGRCALIIRWGIFGRAKAICCAAVPC